MDFTVAERPVTELPEKLSKALEKTLRSGAAIAIDVSEMTDRSGRRLAERLRHQAMASKKPYRVCSKLKREEQKLYVWAEELTPIEQDAEPPPGLDIHDSNLKVP